MEILRASEMGFCFGVRRAIARMEEASQEHSGIQSLGSIVHNQQVVEQLGQRGIEVVKDPEKLSGPTVAITAHGVGPQVTQDLSHRGLEVIDTTCPIVRRSQLAAKKLAEEGFTVVVFGDKDHPEVRGVLGWAGGKGMATLESDFFTKLPRVPRRIGIVAQTTQVPAHYTAFVQAIMEQGLGEMAELRVINTLCDATSKQQQAAMHLAQQVDLMLVVGGHNSANTRHLAEVCEEMGAETHHIESASEIDPAWLLGRERVGVTAGASTPDESVDEVVHHLQSLSQQEAVFPTPTASRASFKP